MCRVGSSVSAEKVSEAAECRKQHCARIARKGHSQGSKFATDPGRQQDVLSSGWSSTTLPVTTPLADASLRADYPQRQLLKL
jgi:hypothetical protein